MSAMRPRDGVGLQARRWLYYQLESIDKGDFRWEFLVPFNNKTLTTTDKFVVCSAFIGLSFTLQTLCGCFDRPLDDAEWRQI